MLWVFFSGATSICNACAVALRTNEINDEIGHHGHKAILARPRPALEQKEVGQGGLVRWHPWTRWAEAG